MKNSMTIDEIVEQLMILRMTMRENAMKDDNYDVIMQNAIQALTEASFILISLQIKEMRDEK